MITLHNPEFLWLLLLLLPLIYVMKKKGDALKGVFSKEVLAKVKLRSAGLSKRSRSMVLIFTMVLTIVALARPQIDKGEINVQSSFINVVTAIDMSKSMFANDVYPNRFEFAKKKFFDALDYFKNSKVALMGFSTQTFLISPLTEDFNALKFLAKNLNLDYLNLQGTDVMNVLESANRLFGEEKKKILLLFTDGSDQEDFSKEIAYAKSHKIVVYVYNIGTSKGGVIKENKSVLKDKNGNIVVVKRSDKIKSLALQSGGAYMTYSLKRDDIKLLVDTIQTHYEAKREESSTIKDRQELFYYPLGLALILYWVSLFSLPKFVSRFSVKKHQNKEVK
ncbi:MAG TPA: VWA domain-containing protein [Campylobacterales bacterium]|nr:VWA domain-containing protein [Campylobacterales bacterium]HHS92855.1 VWA domain-containing protein [Campylobacterales bacterium]